MEIMDFTPSAAFATEKDRAMPAKAAALPAPLARPGGGPCWPATVIDVARKPPSFTAPSTRTMSPTCTSPSVMGSRRLRKAVFSSAISCAPRCPGPPSIGHLDAVDGRHLAHQPGLAVVGLHLAHLLGALRIDLQDEHRAHGLRGGVHLAAGGDGVAHLDVGGLERLRGMACWPSPPPASRTAPDGAAPEPSRCACSR